MKSRAIRLMGIAAVAAIGITAAIGCGKQSDSDQRGVAERTGAAMDQAAENTQAAAKTVAGKTSAAAKQVAETSRDVAGQVVEKTGEIMGSAGSAAAKAGASMEETGGELQKPSQPSAPVPLPTPIR